MIVEVCVGSSCHLRGSQDIIDLLQKAVTEHDLEREVTLAGCFCLGKCDREGVTVRVDDEVFPGITKFNFNEFFKENILQKLG